MASVFTYGTLQVPAVMTAVTGNNFPFEEAVLHGFRRFKIRNRVYPAIVPDDSASTPGILYSNLDTTSLSLLDEFEDILYTRQTVSVNLPASTTSAFAYVLAEEYNDRLSEQEWSLREFEEHHLQSYLQRI